MEPFNQVNCLKYQSKYSYQGQLKSYLIQLSYMLMMDNKNFYLTKKYIYKKILSITVHTRANR